MSLAEFKDYSIIILLCQNWCTAEKYETFIFKGCQKTSFSGVFPLEVMRDQMDTLMSEAFLESRV